SAQSIMTGGLDREAANRLAIRGSSNKGSFQTFEVTPSNQEGLQLAYEMGTRHSGSCMVLVCRIPATTYDELVAGGHVLVQPIPGAGIPETVFLPGAFPTINSEAVWTLLKPG